MGKKRCKILAYSRIIQGSRSIIHQKRFKLQLEGRTPISRKSWWFRNPFRSCWRLRVNFWEFDMADLGSLRRTSGWHGLHLNLRITCFAVGWYQPLIKKMHLSAREDIKIKGLPRVSVFSAVTEESVPGVRIWRWRRRLITRQWISWLVKPQRFTRVPCWEYHWYVSWN